MKYSIDLIVTDIVPWVVRACRYIGIRGVFISNFSWVEIYKEYFKEDIWLKYLECYSVSR